MSPVWILLLFFSWAANLSRCFSLCPYALFFFPSPSAFSFVVCRVRYRFRCLPIWAVFRSLGHLLWASDLDLEYCWIWCFLRIVQMRSPNPICLFYGTWEVCNDLNGVCTFFKSSVFKILKYIARASPTGSNLRVDHHTSRNHRHRG